VSESPDELIAEWLRLEKEYARLGDQARQIMDASGIKDQYEIETRIWPAMYLKNGLIYPRAANPPIQLRAYQEHWRVCVEQSKVGERMKEIRIVAITQGVTLPELTLMELPTDPGDPDFEEAFLQWIGSQPSESQPPPLESPEGGATPKTPIAEKPTVGKTIKPSKTPKDNKPTADEKAIITAINDGLVGEGFCRRLDFEEVSPREGWLSLRHPKPTWPGTYEGAYCHPRVPDREFWKARIQRYKHYVGRKFRHLIRPEDSPARHGE